MLKRSEILNAKVANDTVSTRGVALLVVLFSPFLTINLICIPTNQGRRLG